MIVISEPVLFFMVSGSAIVVLTTFVYALKLYNVYRRQIMVKLEQIDKTTEKISHIIEGYEKQRKILIDEQDKQG